MWGCRTVQAPMPDKEELLGDTRAVTAQEHKWYRSVIGMMCYYAVQTRWDISFEVNRAALLRRHLLLLGEQWHT